MRKLWLPQSSNNGEEILFSRWDTINNISDLHNWSTELKEKVGSLTLSTERVREAAASQTRRAPRFVQRDKFHPGKASFRYQGDDSTQFLASEQPVAGHDAYITHSHIAFQD